MGNLRKKNILWLSLTILLSFSAATVQVGAQTPVLSVKPDDPAAGIGEKFTIKVYLAKVTDLYGFQFKLGYNTSILDIVQVDIKSFLKEPTYTVADEMNETEGWYSLAVTSLAEPPGKSGSGTLATITFKVTGLGNCTLDLYDDILVNSKAEEISHRTIDGEFTTSERPEEPSTPFPVEKIALVIVIAIFLVAALYYVKKRILK